MDDKVIDETCSGLRLVMHFSKRSLGWLVGGAAAAVGFIALVGPAFGS